MRNFSVISSSLPRVARRGWHAGADFQPTSYIAANRNFSSLHSQGTDNAIKEILDFSVIVLPKRITDYGHTQDKILATDDNLPEKYSSFIERLRKHIRKNFQGEFLDSARELFKGCMTSVEFVTDGSIYLPDDNSCAGITTIRSVLKDKRSYRVIQIVVDARPAIEEPSDKNFDNVSRVLFHEIEHAKIGYHNFAKHYVHWNKEVGEYYDANGSKFPKEKVTFDPIMTEKDRLETNQELLKCVYAIKGKDEKVFDHVANVVNAKILDVIKKSSSQDQDVYIAALAMLYKYDGVYNRERLENLIEKESYDEKILSVEAFNNAKTEILESFNTSEGIAYLTHLSSEQIKDISPKIYNKMFAQSAEISLVR